MLQQSPFDRALNEGGFSEMLIPLGCLSVTFGSSSLLLFELGGLTLNLMSLVLSRLPSPAGL